jgi:hypothetical protein
MADAVDLALQTFQTKGKIASQPTGIDVLIRGARPPIQRYQINVMPPVDNATKYTDEGASSLGVVGRLQNELAQQWISLAATVGDRSARTHPMRPNP